jgi:hypothetical protein
MRRRIPNLYHKQRIKGLYDALYAELAEPAGAPPPARAAAIAHGRPSSLAEPQPT